MRTAPGVTNSHERNHRWGVILAGGDGKRLLPLTRTISGDDRPKQFCAVLSNETLLQQTQARISPLIHPQRTLMVFTKAHAPFYVGQVDGIPSSRLLIQPCNQGTAPAILYSLMRLREMDPDAVVAFFPSDHYYSDDQAFLCHVDSAYDAAASRPGVVVVLGIPAETPESEYGWIEPGPRQDGPILDSVLPVRQFWEKPNRALAFKLMELGCLWNSFVMVGLVGSFLYLIRNTHPDLVASFERIRSALRRGTEKIALDEVYIRIRATCFSREVMAARPRDLAVLPATGVGWSDLGEPGRVLSVRSRKGVRSASGYTALSVGAA